jgi:DNA-binding NarL/FixJ family response regulator
VISANQFTLWGMRSMLEASGTGFMWVGSHGPDVGLFKEIERKKPAAVICDAPLQGALLELPQQLRRKKVGLLMVREVLELEEAEALVKLGVGGVIHAGEATATLLSALSHVAQMRLWLPPELVDRMLEKAFSPEDAGEEKISIRQLTGRERQLITLLLRNPEAKAFALGSALNISETTVRNQLSRIYRKLRVRGKAALVMFANKHRLY